ncbi:MAG: alpha/beta fold hydrolase [Planctomycetota bacterium]
MDPFIAPALDRFVIRRVIRALGERAHRPKEFPPAPPAFRELFPADPPPPAALAYINPPGRNNEREFAFPSPAPCGNSANDIARGRHYPFHGRARRASVVLLHGWLDPSYGYTGRLARHLARAGHDVFLLQLPWHMDRKVPGLRSGENALTADLPRSLLTLRQAVADVRALLGTILDRDGGRTGVIGVSFGGWMTALVACAETRLAFAVMAIPALHPTRIVWEEPLGETLRRDLAAAGLDRNRTAPWLDGADPARLAPRIAPERIGLILARHDQFIPLAEGRRLVETWNVPHVVILPEGHISFLFSRGLTAGVTGMMGTILRRG